MMTTWQQASSSMLMILHGHQRSLVGVERVWRRTVLRTRGGSKTYCWSYIQASTGGIEDIRRQASH
jgi:hypothetical protein